MNQAVLQVVQDETAEDNKAKEEYIVNYLKSMIALEEAMEPYKEQKKELRGEYIENGWLTKEDISLTVKAYRLLKDDVDIAALIDVYESLKEAK